MGISAYQRSSVAQQGLEPCDVVVVVDFSRSSFEDVHLAHRRLHLLHPHACAWVLAKLIKMLELGGKSEEVSNTYSLALIAQGVLHSLEVAAELVFPPSRLLLWRNPCSRPPISLNAQGKSLSLGDPSRSYVEA